MTKIVFRQKTPEEMQADAAARQKREASAAKVEARPSAAEAPAAQPPAAVVPPPAAGAADHRSPFKLDGEPTPPKAKRGRKKPAAG